MLFLCRVRFDKFTGKRYYLNQSYGEQIEMKIRDVVKLIEADGWYMVATKGSHRQYKHPTKRGRVTIAGHLNDDLAPGTLNSIFKQAKLQKPKKGK
jgi:predicted RNA binding protein YcfA (HicA-like mRNA interferase family)